MGSKTRKGFDSSITWIALASFAFIIFSSMTDIAFYPWFVSVVFALAGVGFLYEGQARTIFQWAKDGIQRNEFLNVITILLGLFTIVMAILAMPVVNVIRGTGLNSILAFISIICVILIIIQKWIVD